MSRTLALAFVALTCAGCVQRQRPSASATEEWGWLLGRANRAATEGQHARADSMLADFTRRYESALEAREAHFWRAVYLLDPANSSASPRRAITLLNEYLAFRPLASHHLEAAAMRRVALLAESLRRSSAGSQDALSRDEEVQRLREELKKTNEELERIKRRLSAPRP